MNNAGRCDKINFPRQTKYLALCLLVFLMSGCAHTQLINEGDDFSDQGRYELAIQQYDRALEIKPNEAETRDKLQDAKVLYQDWLLTINDAADTAYEQNQQGLALLLYGKVLAGGMNNSQATSRFNRLHDELSAQSLLQVRVHYPESIFGQNLEATIGDILPLQQDYTGLSNEREFTFELVELDSKITEQDEEFYGEYVSGTQAVLNPQIVYLQNQVHQLNHEVKELRRDRAEYEHNVEHAEDQLAQVESRHEVDHHDEQSEALKQAESRLHHAQRKLHKKSDQLEDHEDSLHHTIYQLAHTPATVIEEIYSTHAYLVTHSSFELKGEVIVTEQNHNVAYDLTATSQDSYHEAQFLLGLAADPLIQSSEQQLRSELRASARSFAQDYVRDEVLDYRASLLSSANKTAGRNSRLESQVRYGLSGRDGMDRHVAKTMAQQLQSEYGIVGEFPVDALLHDI